MKTESSCTFQKCTRRRQTRPSIFRFRCFSDHNQGVGRSYNKLVHPTCERYLLLFEIISKKSSKIVSFISRAKYEKFHCTKYSLNSTFKVLKFRLLEIVTEHSRICSGPRKLITMFNGTCNQTFNTRKQQYRNFYSRSPGYIVKFASGYNEVHVELENVRLQQMRNVYRKPHRTNPIGTRDTFYCRRNVSRNNLLGEKSKTLLS